MQNLNLENGSTCLIVRDVFTPDECVSIIEGLRSTVTWSRKPIRVYGKECLQNRMTAEYGEAGCTYRYSGTIHTGTGDIPDVVRDVHSTGASRLVDIGAISENMFNYFLLNRYKDGTESIGEHSDDERGLTGPIVSFSFGASRFFDIRNKRDKSKTRVEVHSGDCVVMSGNMQRHYKHGVPIQKKIKDARFNVTLRRII